MEERFLLGQNSYKIFILNFVPLLILCSIFALITSSSYTLSFVASCCFPVVLYIIAIVRAVFLLLNNNRSLVFGENSVKLLNKKSKIIEEYNYNDIEQVTENNAGKYIIKYKRECSLVQKELTLSSGVAVSSVLCIKVGAMFTKYLGNKFKTYYQKAIDEYMETYEVASVDVDTDVKSAKISTFWAIVNTIIAVILTVWFLPSFLYTFLFVIFVIFGA